MKIWWSIHTHSDVVYWTQQCSSFVGSALLAAFDKAYDPSGKPAKCDSDPLIMIMCERANVNIVYESLRNVKCVYMFLLIFTKIVEIVMNV